MARKQEKALVIKAMFVLFVSGMQRLELRKHIGATPLK